MGRFASSTVGATVSGHLYMKFTVFSLAITLGASAVFGQTTPPSSRKEQAVTSINDRGAATAQQPAAAAQSGGSAGDDMMRIKSPSQVASSGLAGSEAGTVSL